MKKFLLSKDLAGLTQVICHFRKMFERDLNVKSRDWYVPRDFYPTIKKICINAIKEGQYDPLPNKLIHFAQFKCNKTGEILGTQVISTVVEAMDEFQEKCSYVVPDEVHLHLIDERLKRKRESDDKKGKGKSNKKRRIQDDDKDNEPTGGPSK